jgi:hypothetical protein
MQMGTFYRKRLCRYFQFFGSTNLVKRILRISFFLLRTKNIIFAAGFIYNGNKYEMRISGMKKSFLSTRYRQCRWAYIRKFINNTTEMFSKIVYL